MPELCPLTCTPRTRGAKVRVAELAERQWGVVTRAQLEESGLGAAGISRWQDERRLHRVYPGVFAVGHGCLAMEGVLAAAVFYAGAGSALSHVTAAWWFGMLRAQPTRVHVSAPGKRQVSAARARALPKKPGARLAQAPPRYPTRPDPLDIAGVVRFMELRRALAEAEYRRLVTLAEVEAVLGRGRPRQRGVARGA